MQSIAAQPFGPSYAPPTSDRLEAGRVYRRSVRSDCCLFIWATPISLLSGFHSTSTEITTAFRWRKEIELRRWFYDGYNRANVARLCCSGSSSLWRNNRRLVVQETVAHASMKSDRTADGRGLAPTSELHIRHQIALNVSDHNDAVDDKRRSRFGENHLGLLLCFAVGP